MSNDFQRLQVLIDGDGRSTMGESEIVAGAIAEILRERARVAELEASVKRFKSERNDALASLDTAMKYPAQRARVAALTEHNQTLQGEFSDALVKIRQNYNELASEHLDLQHAQFPRPMDTVPRGMVDVLLRSRRSGRWIVCRWEEDVWLGCGDGWSDEDFDAWLPCPSDPEVKS